MRYISLFSGIEAASVAWEPLGMEPVAFSEIDKFASAVLEYRYTNVPNLGDITLIDWEEVKNAYGTVDVVVGGSPCQSFSVAGNREGLKGASGLMWEYVRAIQELRPEWVVWENVPGALSVEGGNAFGQLLKSLDDIGYGIAWRVLDAQFFGVPQRRRRVFLVGCLGDDGTEKACEILFEQDCLRGDNPSSREKRQELARTAGKRAAKCGGFSYKASPGAGSVGFEHEMGATLLSARNDAAVMTQYGEEIAGTLTARADSSPCADRGQNVLCFDTTNITSPTNGNNPQFGDACHTLSAQLHPPTIISFAQNTRDEVRVVGGDGQITGALSANAGMKQQTYICLGSDHANASIDENQCGTLRSSGGRAIVASDYVVRRLTPLECERLQGFPDDWTLIPYKGKDKEYCPDTPRYKALGNSMAVPVMTWIGKRICEISGG